MSLKRQTITGLKWSTINSGVVSILAFIRLWILALLLSPEDFGLMAMVLTVIDLAMSYADTGLSAAIIHRQNADRKELSSLYWLNVASGFILFFIIWALTPIVVMFYKEPRLNLLLPISSLAFIISSFSNQFGVLLQRDVEFSTLAKQEIISTFTGTIIAIILAFSGFKVWSLLLGQLSGVATKTTLLLFLGLKRYRPLLYFSTKDLKGFFSFGLYQMADRTINYLSGRMDQLLIGNLLGAEVLGYYNFAFNLVMQPLFKINSVITVVMFPVFAKIQDDLERLRKGFVELIRFIFSINAPILIGLVSISQMAIVLVFGDKWSGSIIFIQILAFVALLRSTNDPIASIGLAKGRAKLLFLWNLYSVIANFLFMYVGYKIFNVAGIALGLLAVRILFVPLNYVYIIQPTIGNCGLDYFRNMARPISLSMVMAIIVAFLNTHLRHTPVNLILAICIGATIYLVLLYLFDRGILLKVKEQLRKSP
ncbi:MAG: MOP flippase family protein [Syntrophorhabdaceae bacterium]|nr:MOP flippase family protein [Syntrophorhabdaceae bacterium]